MSNPHDRQILNSVVNPLLPLGEGVFDDDRVLPDTLQDEEPDSAAVKRSKALEKKAVLSCEEGRLSEALALLTEAVSVAPERPSPFNNRAQVYRLQGDTDLALKDLESAIELSGGRGRSACQAFCQRGLILRRDGRDDEALADFRKSADLGSDFAKSLLVQLNPYAAMCNKMLKNVFKALEEGSDAVQNPFKNVDINKHQG